MKSSLFIILFSTFLISEDTMSLSQLKALCFRKDVNSCNLVASWYFSQQYKLKDALKESKVYYSLSCTFGDPKGCYEVGTFYLNGQAGLSIKEAAMSYFEVSCLGGYPEACFQLGSLYITGKNGYQNIDKSIYYFKKSCYLGYKDGCSNYQALFRNLTN